jgi:putative endonuclease
VLVSCGTTNLMVQKVKNTKETGTFGESIASIYLEKHGFYVIERNYSKKWGELDIIARKDNKVHFIEVKSVSYETKADLDYAVTHETWRPEEQVHQFKLHQIEKALTTWISDKGFEGEWQIDVIAVRLVPRETFSTVKYIENITN